MKPTEELQQLFNQARNLSSVMKLQDCLNAGRLLVTICRAFQLQ